MKLAILFLVTLLAFPAYGEVNVENTPEQFLKDTTSPGPKVLILYADWCEACHLIGPHYAMASLNYKFPFLAVNIDNPEFKALMPRISKADYIPQIMVARDGKQLFDNPCMITLDGSEMSEIQEQLEKKIQKCLSGGK